MEAMETRLATQKQVRHLELEAKKNELSIILKEIDSDIQAILNLRAYNLPNNLLYKHYFTDTSTFTNYYKTQKPHILDDYDEYNIKKLYELFSILDKYIEIVDSNFDGSPLSYHYKRKYFDTALILIKNSNDTLQLEILGKQAHLNYAIP